MTRAEALNILVENANITLDMYRDELDEGIRDEMHDLAQAIAVIENCRDRKWR